MSRYLPYVKFKWLNQTEIDKFSLNSISENSSNGYILKIDLEYPDELHEMQNDYLLAPEKLDYFKLINISGKTMENLRKRMKVRLVNNAGNYRKHLNKPSFVSQKVFNENFVAIHELKPVLTLAERTYVCRT